MKIVFLVFLITNFLFSSTGHNHNTITHNTFEAIKKIEILLGENKNDEALKGVQNLQKRLFLNRANRYEKAFVKKFEGYIFISLGKYQKSIDIFAKLYDERVLKKSENISLIHDLAQLNLAVKNYKGAIKYFMVYLKFKPTPKVYESISIAYNNLGDYENAIKWMKQAIASSKNPKKSWYEYLKGLYYTNAEYYQSIVIQKKIFETFGVEKKGLFFIVSIYQLKEKKSQALYYLQMAYDMKYFSKEEHYLSLAYLLQEKKLYFKSATVVNDGIKKGIVKKDKENYTFMFNNYYESKEYQKAIDALEKLAKKIDRVDVYLQIAQLHMDNDSYKKAISALKKVLVYENNKKLGDTFILLGICFVELNDEKNAKIYFTKALETDKSKSAKKWLSFLRSDDEV